MASDQNQRESLEHWLAKQPREQFPPGCDYPAQYQTVSEYMNTKVHPSVEKGALLNDPEHEMYLTGHGPHHVATVINRASEICRESHLVLSPYEVYVLLMAIHLHDAGIIHGRDEHEKRCREIMAELGKRAGEDALEKRVIVRIASAHGGYVTGEDKDTIGPLDDNDPYLLNMAIRKPLLAAILRFADELSDDKTRASRFVMSYGGLPQGAEIYHKYADSLHSVIVGEFEVKMRFEFNQDTACQQFSEKGTPTYLLDYIFRRTLKMHLERTYCMRFMQSLVRINEVQVQVEVYDNTYNKRMEQIKYRMQEKGYPASPEKGLHALCPDLIGISGQVLCERLLRQGSPINGNTNQA